jgi:hypothetical protein
MIPLMEDAVCEEILKQIWNRLLQNKESLKKTITSCYNSPYILLRTCPTENKSVKMR